MKGRVTIPSEAKAISETAEFVRRVGADAVRDCDGTSLPDEIKQLGVTVYGTYFPARGWGEFTAAHPEYHQHLLLMSRPYTATEGALTVPLCEDCFTEQLAVDTEHTPALWWEVIDRTTGEVLPSGKWQYDGGCVIIPAPVPFHRYTVSYFARVLWDPTQMYNHLTNNWGDVPHDVPFDIRSDEAFDFAKSALEKWLSEHTEVDVVRFTTFFYHFTLYFNAAAKEKFVDWFGYGTSVSPDALLDFADKYGYRLRPEDIVDGGFYNSTFRPPSKAYLDYMDFVGRFVSLRAAELVEIVHRNGRRAMMFLGDTWIGAEPYGKYFGGIGLDAVVGSVGGGATLRLIADIPGIACTEGRLLPYFFPDVFSRGNDPTGEAKRVWLAARRALLRNPLSRIGWGGYPSLAAKFPEFMDYTEKIADEFRDIHDKTEKAPPLCRLRAAVLGCWGALRSWQNSMVAHGKPYRAAAPYHGVQEALSGLAADVRFISFDDLRRGAAEDCDVIINCGAAGTAFSGGDEWADESVVSALRRFVYGGGGFIGIGEPTAYLKGGSFFQLSDVMGVERELGFSLSFNKYPQNAASHFITEDCIGYNLGDNVPGVYASSPGTEVLAGEEDSVRLAAHSFGGGRSVYISGLPYSAENTRLLWRSLLWASHKEAAVSLWHTENPSCEVAVYPAAGRYAVINNTDEPQETAFYDGDGRKSILSLPPSGLLWREMSGGD